MLERLVAAAYGLLEPLQTEVECMSMRAAMLTGSTNGVDAALAAALTYEGTVAEVKTLGSGPHSHIRAAMLLMVFRPDLVIIEDCSFKFILAVLYRWRWRRSRLLVRIGGTDQRPGFIRRLVLSQADGVLAEDEAADHPANDWANGDKRLSHTRVFSMFAPIGLEPFLTTALFRTPAQAYRLVYAGPISPYSGVADILMSVAAWAERNLDREVEIWWIGEGDLTGVLEAQPLPDNMSQLFLGALAPEPMAKAFTECGIMVLPLHGFGRALVAEALATGLVVVGDVRGAHARRLLSEGTLGWTFDPQQTGALLDAVGQALTCPFEQLVDMRFHGRELVSRAAIQGTAERLRAVWTMVMPSATEAAARQTMVSAGQAAMDNT